MSTHRISDFQVLAVAGNVRNLKSVILLHFLKTGNGTSSDYTRVSEGYTAAVVNSDL